MLGNKHLNKSLRRKSNGRGQIEDTEGKADKGAGQFDSEGGQSK